MQSGKKVTPTVNNSKGQSVDQLSTVDDFHPMARCKYSANLFSWSDVIVRPRIRWDAVIGLAIAAI